jgi:hypothetical protein
MRAMFTPGLVANAGASCQFCPVRGTNAHEDAAV